MGRRYIGLFLLAAGVGLAQSTDPSLTFEVASVKPSEPPNGRMMMMGGRGGPGTNDPGRFTTTNLPLKMLLARGFGVKDFQIQGPGWLETERFDIAAKVPAGTTKEQFNVMLQNLLLERFQMKVHREKKELPLFTLTVGKSGPKLKETTLDASAFAPPPNDGGGRGGPDAARAGPPPPPAPGQFPKLPEGRPGMRMMFTEGRLMLTAAGQGISNMIDFLTMQLGRPVVDGTGLTGKYDFQLEFAPEAGQGPFKGLPPPPPGAGPGPGGGDGGGPASSAEPAQNLVTAVQQLGLKLVPGKGPVDLIVIDKAEKVPIEN
jgi:uncharacterized protein (TIGR03435 family)